MWFPLFVLATMIAVGLGVLYCFVEADRNIVRSKLVLLTLVSNTADSPTRADVGFTPSFETTGPESDLEEITSDGGKVLIYEAFRHPFGVPARLFVTKDSAYPRSGYIFTILGFRCVGSSEYIEVRPGEYELVSKSRARY
jgi:hypothetical protein